MVLSTSACSRTHGAKMDVDRFWSVVETGKNSSQPDVPVAATLRGLSASDVVSYQEQFDRFFAEAYRWDLWSAAYVIGGGCSDDGFIDFRYGLISRGREVYRKAIANPDSLADLGERVDLENESFGYVALEVYEEKAGTPLPRTKIQQPSEPAGEEWDFEDQNEVKKRLPRLSTLMAGIWKQRIKNLPK